MKKYQLVPALLVARIIMCSGCNQSETLADKKEQLKAYKEQINDLKVKVKKLENEILQADTTNNPDEEKKLVSLKTVKTKSFKHFVKVRGEASSKKNVSLSAELSGLVTEINHSEGEQVQKGEVIAKLENESIKQSIDEIKTNLELAKDIYQKRKNLWEKNIGSEIEYLQAKNEKDRLQKRLASTKSELDKTIIKAPISGEIDEIFINEGELANPASPICRIVNLDQIRLSANLSESYLGKINQGDSVSIKFPSIGVQKMATISHVGQFIAPESRTFKIEVKLQNQDHLIKPNMMGIIRFADYANSNALIIPSKIIQEEGDKNYIYLAKNKDRNWQAEKTYVEIGRTHKGETEIKNGLESGDKLIVQGFRDVNDGENLRQTSK